MRDVSPGHYPDCLRRTDPSEECTCEQIEDTTIAVSSLPNPADLIRRARAKGLLEAAPAYG